MAGGLVSHSVVCRLKLGEFRELPTPVKKKLVQLMARISEASYRRGFQHGTLGRHNIDPQKFRRSQSLDSSPFTDRPGGLTAIERLNVEYGLSKVGLWAEDEDSGHA